MKIEIVKQSKTMEQTTFLVTPRGMVGSLRTPPAVEEFHGDITIGRQAINEEGMRPNDITLSISDLAISRTHCRIIYNYGFKSIKRKMQAEWLEFSKLFVHNRMAHKHVYLPVHIRKLILSYLITPRHFYIQDMGSTHGTYVRMTDEPSLKQHQFVRKGQSYLIGADIYLNVVELQTNKDFITHHKVAEYQEEKLFKSMIRFFANEVQLGTEIHGCISKKQLLSTIKKRRE